MTTLSRPIRRTLLALAALTLVIAACYPPSDVQIVTDPTEEPVDLTGGVALTIAAHGADNLLLRPITAVLASGSWDRVRFSQDWQDLAATGNCIEMVLVRDREGDDSVTLAYSPAATGGVVTPTQWSEYTDLEAVADAATQMNYTSLAVTPSFAIDRVVQVEPNQPCEQQSPADEFDFWTGPDGVDSVQIERIVMSMEQPDGTIARVMVVVEPANGAGCDFVHSACSKCQGCGYGFVCSVAKRICSN